MTDNMYYTREPDCASAPQECFFSFRGHSLRCKTDAGVFSKGELDDGTRLLIDALPELRGRVLDLGCGWGPIGISVKRAWPGCAVTMADVNLRALGLAKENLTANRAEARVVESDGMSAFAGETFDAVITNPPIRAGKQVIYGMFADISRQLTEDGALYLVIRKQQGAESCLKYLKTLFASVEKLDKKSGFWVLCAREAIREDGQSNEV